MYNFLMILKGFQIGVFCKTVKAYLKFTLGLIYNSVFIS